MLCQLLLPKVLIVNVLCEVLEVLHVSPDEHVSQEEEVAVPLVLNCTHTDTHIQVHTHMYTQTHAHTCPHTERDRGSGAEKSTDCTEKEYAHTTQRGHSNKQFQMLVTSE